MSVLVDTGVLVGAKLPADPLHAPASAALERALARAWGQPFVTDYIVDEAVTLARVRSRQHEAAEDLAAFLLGEAPYAPLFQLLRVDEASFATARAAHRRYGDRFLSFTDCTSIALVEAAGLDGILSFDRGFDGIMTRFEPLEAPGPAAPR